MLYSGAGKVDALLDSPTNTVPDIEVTDEYDVVHRVWKISDASVIVSVQQQMRDRKLIIADGHHRYETALTYRNERRAAAETSAGLPAPYDSVMMTFVDMDLPEQASPDKDRPAGLVILPTHRLVFGLPSFSAEQFQAEARKFFNLEEVDAGIDAPRATAILQNAGHAGTALLAVTAERAFLLHTPKAIGTALFGKLSLRQQALDVVQLHKLPARRRAEHFRGSHSQSGKRFLLSRSRGSPVAGAKRKGAGGVPDESGADGAGSRHRLCRPGPAPEVHRFLPQVAQRSHDLCAGVEVPGFSTQFQLSAKVRHWELRTGYWNCWPPAALLSALPTAPAARPLDDKHVSVYSPVAIYTLPVVERAGRDYVGLLELLEPLGRVSTRLERTSLRLRYNASMPSFSPARRGPRFTAAISISPLPS
jgi:hypothetical protein